MKNRTFTYFLFLLIGAGVGIIGCYLFAGNKTENNTASNNSVAAKSNKKRKVLYWRAPMNPKELYDHPGKSNMGMELVPVYADQAAQNGVVSVDPVMVQDMNVKTAIVKAGHLYTDVYTNGIIQPDEQKQYTVTTKTGGWIDKLYVNYTGQQVRKGQKLLRIYSPQLVAAEQEYLTALAYDKAMKNSQKPSDLLENAQQKLELLDVSTKEIQQLKATQKVQKYMMITAPFDGTVMFKGIEEGAKINPGTPLMKIANLKSLWLMADIYAYELDKVALEQPVTITMDYLPGQTFKGKISFIYPTLNTQTRTVKVRIDLQNKNGELKPGMFASVDIQGKDLGVYPLVPEQAILRSGRKNTVILALGGGKFKPVKVKLGAYAKGYYQVLDGLSANTKIVTSAQFLIDSESNLNASLDMFSGAKKDTTKSKKEVKKMNMEKKPEKKAKESELVRKGVIDVEAIDKNHDGKLYEDVMDWNVISDKPGTCPLCGMKLREMTIQQVKDNLKAHGYQFK